ncbi:hypothetical protein F0562_009333 [Nyssa sinensis]|uniref:START domain-containing protein n=1 Tax=Nyssa sinensis TaxID=561372 RepID=A0A5J4ZX68_9ASTE|nr:hypothetical protein F0562_009333 [Nyssa sinensis]
MLWSASKKAGSAGGLLESGRSESGSEERPGYFEYFGCVYHLRVSSIGVESWHLRFLFIRGKHVEMYKRDPHENPCIKPIRRGVVGHTLMVEELGRRKVNNGDVYVLRFYNRLDESKKGEIASPSAGEARTWMEAFDHAKQQAEYELSRGGSTRNKLNMETEINLEGHQHRVRRYAHGLKKLIRIGQGPESLLRQSSDLGVNEGDAGDAIEAHEWKCVRIINGVRIFEDVANAESRKGALVKAVGVIDASADTVFEVVLNLDRRQRYEWDVFTGDLELVDSSDGHFDVVYGTHEPRYLTSVLSLGRLSKAYKTYTLFFYYIYKIKGAGLCRYDFAAARYSPHLLPSSFIKTHPNCLKILSEATLLGQALGGRLGEEKLGFFHLKHLRWHSKRDFVFSRHWFRGQDGTYTILQLPAVHKKRPPKSGYQRTKINPSSWEITNLNTRLASDTSRCLVTLMLEMHSVGWCRWKNNQGSKFEKTVPYALLSQVSGLKEYVGAKQVLTLESSTVIHSKFSDGSSSCGEYEEEEVVDEFYDAIAADSSEDDDSDSDIERNNKGTKVKLKNVSWAIAGLALRRASALDANKELDLNVPQIILDPRHFHASMHQGKDESDTNCWTSPSGTGFMIRGKTYLKDNSKVTGGDPLLKLLAVDWFKVENSITKVALHPRSLVQSEAGKKLPFVLVVNLEVPARPNYNLVLYYAADRPVRKNSLLGKFVDGTDMFRDSRFKLIPSIVEGYWMVKRAVGTRACLLGKAVACKYLRQDNFLEIDVDIGSSSVARGVIGLVLGYVASIIVDLAILIEAKEEVELPEYILGTVRLNRVRLDSAVPLEV